MREWLRLQCWGALRTWAWLSRALPADVLATEALRISSQRQLSPQASPTRHRDPGDAKASPHSRRGRTVPASPYDGAGASSSHVRSPTAGALAGGRGGRHVSAFVRQGRSKWVRGAMAAAAGRTALLALIPGTPLYRSPRKPHGSSGSPRTARVARVGGDSGSRGSSRLRQRVLDARAHQVSNSLATDREDRGTAYRHKRYPQPPPSKRGDTQPAAQRSKERTAPGHAVVVVAPPSVERAEVMAASPQHKEVSPNARRRGGIAAVVDHKDHKRRTQHAKDRRHQRPVEPVYPHPPASLRRAQQRAGIGGRQRSFKRPAARQRSGRRLKMAVPEHEELGQGSVTVKKPPPGSRAYPASALGSGADLIRHHRGRGGAARRDLTLPGVDNVTVGNSPPLALFQSPGSPASSSSNPLALGAVQVGASASPRGRTQMWSLV